LSKIIVRICRKYFNSAGNDQDSDQNIVENSGKSIGNTEYVSKKEKYLSKKEDELFRFEHSLREREGKLADREKDIQVRMNDLFDQKNQMIDQKQVVFDREIKNSYKIMRLAEAENLLIEKEAIINNLTKELKEANKQLNKHNAEPVPQFGIAGLLEQVKSYLPVINTGLLGFIVYILKSNGQANINVPAIKDDVKNLLGDVIDLIKSSKSKSTEELLQEVIKKYEKRNAAGKPTKPQ